MGEGHEVLHSPPLGTQKRALSCDARSETPGRPAADRPHQESSAAQGVDCRGRASTPRPKTCSEVATETSATRRAFMSILMGLLCKVSGQNAQELRRCVPDFLLCKDWELGWMSFGEPKADRCERKIHDGLDWLAWHGAFLLNQLSRCPGLALLPHHAPSGTCGGELPKRLIPILPAREGASPSRSRRIASAPLAGRSRSAPSPTIHRFLDTL